MKNSFKYAFFILLMLGIIIAIEVSLPRKFSWTPTFSRNDKQPFGSYVFDEILTSSLSEGYTLSGETFSQMCRDSFSKPRCILTVNTDLDLSNEDVCAILRLAEQGNKIFLVASSLSENILDTLGIEEETGYFSFKRLKYYANHVAKRDTLVLQDSVQKEKRYSFYGPFIESYFYWVSSAVDSIALQKDSVFEVIPDKNTALTRADTVKYRVLAKDTAGFPVALSFSVGKGRVCLVSTPLVFTNYGMLDGHNAEYIFGVLAEGRNLPLVRTQAYGKNQVEQQSPLRFILSQEPLKWSLYFCMVCIILCMVFTAKRKQRAIPVFKEPQNKSLEFIQLVGTLYYQKRDYTDLVRKKYIYFTEYLKCTTGIRIEAEADDDELYRKLAEKTGTDAASLKKLLSELRQIQTRNIKLTESEMRKYIDRMNQLMNTYFKEPK